MPKIFFKPADGLKVPHPPEARPAGRKHVDPAGECVEDSSYWRRRERDGDGTISASAPRAPDEAPVRAAKGDSK